MLLLICSLKNDVFFKKLAGKKEKNGKKEEEREGEREVGREGGRELGKGQEGEGRKRRKEERKDPSST